MEDYFYSADIGDGRKLCLAPLTDWQIQNSGQDIPEFDGYFLFERDSANRIEVIAKVISEEAILRICDAFNLK